MNVFLGKNTIPPSLKDIYNGIIPQFFTDWNSKNKFLPPIEMKILFEVFTEKRVLHQLDILFWCSVSFICNI